MDSLNWCQFLLKIYIWFCDHLHRFKTLHCLQIYLPIISYNIVTIGRIYSRVGPDIQPFSVSGRIPDIETFWSDTGYWSYPDGYKLLKLFLPLLYSVILPDIRFPAKYVSDLTLIYWNYIVLGKYSLNVIYHFTFIISIIHQPFIIHHWNYYLTICC